MGSTSAGRCFIVTVFPASVLFVLFHSSSSTSSPQFDPGRDRFVRPRQLRVDHRRRGSRTGTNNGLSPRALDRPLYYRPPTTAAAVLPPHPSLLHRATLVYTNTAPALALSDNCLPKQSLALPPPWDLP